MTPTERKEFVVAYLECALWAETASGVPEDTGDGTFDTSFESYGFTLDDIAPAAKRSAFRRCLDFIAANDGLMEATGGSPEQHGHDLWLTSCGHGAGFWDRGYGADGARLTQAAKACASCDLYVSDTDEIEGF